jgi:peptidoglycan/LPS O-acetylase OafA/YrhL
MPRPLPARPRVAGVDAIRGLAALSVAVGHAWFLGGMAPLDRGPLRALIASTYMGVDVFFVISGLVLLAPVAAGRPLGRPSEFYLRRLARIGPLYLLCLTVAVVAHRSIFPGAPVPPQAAGWQLVAAHLLFVQDELFAGKPGYVGFGGASVVWTLSIEMSFYLVLPLLARWWVRRPWHGLLAALLLARLWTTAVTTLAQWGPAVGLHPTGVALVNLQVQLLMELPTYAAHFGLGMTLAVLLLHPRYAGLRRRLQRHGRAIALVGTALLLAFMDRAGQAGLHGHAQPTDHLAATSLLLPGVALLVFGVAVRPVRALQSRPARFLADTSYGLYLIHLMLLRFAIQRWHLDHPGSDRAMLSTLSVVAVAYLLAALSFRWFETPARRLLTTGSLRPSSRRPVTAPSPPAAQPPAGPATVASRSSSGAPRQTGPVLRASTDVSADPVGVTEKPAASSSGAKPTPTPAPVAAK